MKPIMHLMFFVLTSLSLVACSLAPVNIPEAHVYLLKGRSFCAQRAPSLTKKVLLVFEPVPSFAYSTQQMRYMITPYRLQSFAQHQWAEPPAQMITPILSQAIRRLHDFKAVVNAPFSGLSDDYLQTQLLAFEQNFMQPISRFVLVMQATLINSHTHQVIASRHFLSIMRASGNNPYAGVLAAKKALDQVSQKIAQFIDQQLFLHPHSKRKNHGSYCLSYARSGHSSSRLSSAQCHR